MSLNREEKTKVISEYRLNESDTGSSEVQIALITKRIDQLTSHFQTHKKDHASRRGLIRLVNARRSLLQYLKATGSDRYTKLVKALGLRG